MENKILEAALNYQRMGFSVIPFNGKQPITKWEIYQKERADEAQIKAWFDNESPPNVGFVAGAISDLAVIDIDTEEGKENIQDYISDSLIMPAVLTPRGGQHLYFHCPDSNLRGHTGRPLGCDLRANGNCVIAPPSIGKNGKKYEWLIDLSTPKANLPEPYLSFISANIRNYANKNNNNTDTSKQWNNILILSKPESKTAVKELYKGVHEGLRNDSLTRIIGSLVSDGLTFGECLEFACLWNQRNSPPLPEKEVERVVESIFKKHHNNTYSSELIDPLTFLKKGSDILSLECNVEWLVDRLIPKQSITLLHGKGGIGKTWLSLILANAVSKGIPFMDLGTQGTPVVYLDFENPLPVLIERVKKIGASEVLFWHNSNEIKPPKLNGKEWEQYYKRLPVGLLIFDTLRGSQDLDENDSRDMAFILSRLKELRDIGFTIILLHHTPKSNEKIYKGSTAIFDSVDHVLSLHRVRRGNYEEVDDDDEDYCYRLGTKDKTRYEPFHIFLDFNIERGFSIVPDPDTENLEAIHELLTEKGRLNQSQLFDLVKDQLGIRRKNKLTSLLRKGEGQLWRAVKEGRCTYYERASVSTVHSIYMRTGDTGSQPSSRMIQIIPQKT